MNEEFRYTRTSEQASFLVSLVETARKRILPLPEGTVLYRAQIGHAWGGPDDMKIPAPYPSARMKPLAEFASDGRINPRGIPYLYLSSDQPTAALEVRPQIGCYITIAQFKLVRDLVVIDCSRSAYPEADVFDLRRGKSADDVEEMIWTDLSRSFSMPATVSEGSTDYVPTQVISETFRAAGHGGIAYKSGYGPYAKNFALFDLESANVIKRQLFYVSDLSIELKRGDATYWHRFFGED